MGHYAGKLAGFSVSCARKRRLSWWKAMRCRIISTCVSAFRRNSAWRTRWGFLKGKSAIRIHRECLGQPRNFTGLHFWAKGYCVSTVGLDEQTILQYIRDQEAEEKRLEQMPLKGL